ncbi:MAG: ester cyclase [Acetobacteraceae bacterium]
MKSLIEKLHRLWNTGDLSVIPDIYAPDFIAHMPKGWEKSEFKGHHGVRAAIEDIRNAFSEWTETVEDMIIGEGKVVRRYVSTGVHTGPFIGLAPTGKHIRLDEISIYRVQDGLVAEQWCLTDETLARQLTSPEQ